MSYSVMYVGKADIACMHCSVSNRHTADLWTTCA